MDLFMPPGYGGKKRKSPTPPNSFQKELQAKMKQRKQLGLSADITASEQESDDELASDDELMAHFNMTSKHGKQKETKQKKSKTWQSPDSRTPPIDERRSPASKRSSPHGSLGGRSSTDFSLGRKTPYSEEDDEDDYGFEKPSNLMMTMKKPMKPMDFLKRGSNSKSKVSDKSVDDSLDGKRWAPPTASRRDDDNDRSSHSRSPSINRRTPTSTLMDALKEEPPKPSPRLRKQPYVDREDRKSPSDGLHTPTSGRKTPSDERRTPPGRQTPPKRAGTPETKRVMFGRNTPTDDMKSPGSGRKTPTASNLRKADRKKTLNKSLDDNSPKVQKKSVFDMFASKPSNEKDTSQGRSRGKGQEKKKSLLAESDSDSDIGMGAPRESPKTTRRNRQSPDKDYRGSPSLRRTGGSRTPVEVSEDELDGMRPSLRGNKYDRGSPKKGHSRDNSPYESRDIFRRGNDDSPSAFRRKRQDSDEEHTSRSRDRSRPQSRTRPERDSSLCRDVDEDPTLRKKKKVPTATLR